MRTLARENYRKQERVSLKRELYRARCEQIALRFANLK
jgi:hypothetical protein